MISPASAALAASMSMSLISVCSPEVIDPKSATIKDTFCRLAASVCGHLGHSRIDLHVVRAALIGTSATGKPAWLVVSICDAARYMLDRQAQDPSASEFLLIDVKARLSKFVAPDTTSELLGCISSGTSIKKSAYWTSGGPDAVLL